MNIPIYVSLYPHSTILRVCLLECSMREVRVVVAAILEKTLESALHFGDPGLDGLTDALLSLLDKDVPENVKNCAQYFSLFSNFAQRVRNKFTDSVDSTLCRVPGTNMKPQQVDWVFCLCIHSLRVVVLVSCCWNTQLIAGCSCSCWDQTGRITRYNFTL